ncbi:MAG: PTS fructose transporter subunit IIB [Firmicutes bacterium]|nr:PTS fructose transporter subunit IIB [Candidatus Fermentithermobacillaceae bacterium]
MKIVGVTACPAGIAHTYMAAEALEREAKARGFQIKIETQGSMGVENELTAREIAEADVVIFAVDMKVSGAQRFDGKLVVWAGVAEAIRNPGSVIDRAIEELQNASGKSLQEEVVNGERVRPTSESPQSGGNPSSGDEPQGENQNPKTKRRSLLGWLRREQA